MYSPTSIFNFRTILRTVIPVYSTLFFYAVDTIHAQTCNQVEITVYRDYNADGTQNTYEPGISNIEAEAFDPNGISLGSASSASDGLITISLSTAASTLRVDLSTFPSFYEPGKASNTSGTTVLFLGGTAGCTANVGLSNPSDYCQEDPSVAITSFNKGDPLLGGTSGLIVSLVSFPYSASGQPASMTGPAPDVLAIASQTGTTWGLAWQRSSKKLFASAFLRRFAGLGPLGTGGIYQADLSDPNNPVISSFLDIQTLGISTGADPRVTSGIPLSGSATSNAEPDGLAAEFIGKISIGDIDISEDESTLWLANLLDKTIYSIEIGVPAVAPTSSSAISSFPIPTELLNCSDDEYAVWGLKFRDGKVIVGAVCTAQTSGDPNDLDAYILELDPVTSEYSVMINFDLNYTRGLTSGSGLIWPIENADDATWHPWIDDFSMFAAPGGGLRSAYTQPIISDIEFNSDGSMNISIMDRYAITAGFANRYPPPYENDPIATAGISGGDTLIFCKDSNGNYVQENNGVCGALESAGGQGNGEGPGGGEFYDDNQVHPESELGGLAVLLGNGEMISSFFDPFTINSSGVRWHSALDGSTSRNYELIDITSPSFGKASSLGDLELLCDLPPLQIGNRIWLDIDRDGIQDPGETPIEGVTVNLVNQDTNVVVATTTTNSNGEWLFSTADGLEESTDYIIRLNEPTDYESEGALVGLSLTALQLTTSNLDSDGTTVDQFPGIILQTGKAGQNNHTYDIGFVFSQEEESELSTLLAIDSLGLDFSKVARKALRKAKKGRRIGLCNTKITKNALQEKFSEISVKQSQIWITTWGLPLVSYDYTEANSPLACSVMDLTTEVTTLKNLVNSIYSIVETSLNNCTESYKNQVLSKVKLARRKVRKQIKKVPNPNVSCPD